MVGAAFVVAVCTWGIGFYGPPIFLHAIHGGRGWPVTLISAAITVHFLLGAVVIGNLAALHARFGVAAVTRAGAVLTSLGLVGWAVAAEPWQLFAVTPLSAAGWAMTSAAALNAMISPWFARRRPAALSMAYNGASVGGVIFSPLWVALIDAVGFPWAAVLVGTATGLTTWTLAGHYLRQTPAEMGLVVDGGTAGPLPVVLRAEASPIGAGGVWRNRRFTTLVAGVSLGLFAQIGLIVQLFSLLVPRLGDSFAGTLMGLATVCAVAGRSIPAVVLPAGTSWRAVAAVNVALQAVGSVALLLAAGQSAPLLIAGTLLFGLGIGNVASLPALIAQADFAAADLARVVGLVFAVSQAALAFAPLAFGALRAIGPIGPAGPAPLLFAVAAVLQLASAGALLAGAHRAA